MEEKKSSGNGRLFMVIGLVVAFICGCVVCSFAVVGGAGIFALEAQTEDVKRQSFYTEPVTLAKENAEVTEALGEPIVDSITFLDGRSQYQLESEHSFANLNITLTGPKGTANLQVDAAVEGGVWIYEVMQVQLSDGRVILLLGE